MSLNISNKIVLVTGANRGIGEGFVKTLLEAGAKKIYACARDIDSLNELVEKAPNVITPLALDITSDQQIDNVVNAIPELDVLVNNAGIIEPALCSSETALNSLEKEMAVNLVGPMKLTNALLPVLKQSSQAAIINISSIAGLANFPGIGTYSISKAAMHSYTQGLRADLKNENVQVVGVYPGPIDTRMAKDFEMDKAAPAQVAVEALKALEQGATSVFPDDFSKQMHATYLEDPEQLAQTFASFG